MIDALIQALAQNKTPKDPITKYRLEFLAFETMDQKGCEINIKECGICQESNNEKSLISPCDCRGGSQSFHRQRLRWQWLHRQLKRSKNWSIIYSEKIFCRLSHLSVKSLSVKSFSVKWSKPVEEVLNMCTSSVWKFGCKQLEKNFVEYVARDMISIIWEKAKVFGNTWSLTSRTQNRFLTYTSVQCVLHFYADCLIQVHRITTRPVLRTNRSLPNNVWIFWFRVGFVS